MDRNPENIGRPKKWNWEEIKSHYMAGLDVADITKLPQYKGKPPIISYQDRAEILLSCKYVDQVIPNFGNEDSKPAIVEASPDIIAIGSDWARKDYYKQMQFTQDWLDKLNISLIYIPYTQGISSTDIKTRL